VIGVVFGVGARVPGVAGRACGVVDARVGLTVGVPGRAVAWRTAVGTGSAVRAMPGVDVATLAAGGSGLDVSRLRGRLAVGVPRGVATGATTAGAGFAGRTRGTAGGSAMTGPLNGVRVATADGEAVVADGCMRAAVGGADTGAPTASGSTVGVAAEAVASGSAASIASSSSTRCTTIVLPSPSR
jgi:hypothetical protein